MISSPSNERCPCLFRGLPKGGSQVTLFKKEECHCVAQVVLVLL